MARLHEWNPDLRETLPHVQLGSDPTPVRPLPGLDRGVAPIWLKDDGAFGDGGWGGNKVRKLEWLIPDAKRRGRQTILTVGGLGTNWGLATALYGREQGLDVAMGLVDQPIDDHVRDQLERLKRSGATLYFTRTKPRTILSVPWLYLVRHAKGGRPPYTLSAGGSSPVGVLGYVEAALEIAAQVDSGELPEPGHVIVPVGTGGTVAGLLLGFSIAGLPTRVVGVIVNDQLRLNQRSVTKLARRTARLIDRRATRGGDRSRQVPDFEESNLILTRDWLGRGYGHSTPEGEAAQAESIDGANLKLDPVYTAKSMAALLRMNETGAFGEKPVLFLNTNGPR
ncbi:MAG: pyridoxal-phosphate dependent enzyme [Actinomycetota bacterium]|nr:pyridoxal-phosphate dependent enzyme [Actinomycetota bacterium]